IRHALRPASLQIVTVIGLQLGFMLGGSVIFEPIFAYPGLGTIIFRSVQTRDFPVVQGGVILVGVSFALVNLIVDIGYAYLDPLVLWARQCPRQPPSLWHRVRCRPNDPKQNGYG